MVTRVFHCDDSEAFTRLVALQLAEHSDIVHVGRAHSAADALAALPDAQPDVVLLDTMGSPNCDPLLNAVRDRVPGAKVVVYSGYALGGEADAYLRKGGDDGALVETIRAVAAT